jgi:regulation of enolase protein 1 (concanavalin A-like superfamily)
MKYLLPLLAVTAITAAPAPKPQTWVQGWEKPVGPLRDCRIDPDGDKLTVTIPGKDHGFDVRNNRLNGPSLMREVEGDFLIQVRVASSFKPRGEEGHHRAGLLFRDGETYFKVQLTANRTSELRTYHFHLSVQSLGTSGSSNVFKDGPSLEKPVYLRVVRKGQLLSPSWSEDGKTWAKGIGEWGMGPIPGLLKVGVVAEATTDGEFKVVFDQFELTRPKK